MKTPEPIARDEAYRVIRELVVRMDATTKASETLAEARERFAWAVAIDKLLDAADALR